MQSRKDLLEAHRLMARRATLALLGGDPDPADQPLRRLNVSAMSSVLIAAMIAAAFGIWGLLAPGAAQGLNAPGVLIIDKQTGTSYISCAASLCPVVNYASARLALGSSSPAQRLVSQASLAHYSRGPLIGIPGLPQPLPDRSMLVGLPWSVCVQSVTSAAGAAATQPQAVTTLVGGQNVGGTSLRAGSALLVQAQGQDWLLAGGQRLLVDQNMTVNLLFPNSQPAPVPAGWLNGVPQGADFAPPAIAGYGNTVQSPAGGQATVGQVYQVNVPGAATQYYVLLDDGGLALITPTQQRLLEFLPQQPPLKTLSPMQIAGHLSKNKVPDGGLPAQVPVVARYDPATALCENYSGSGQALANPALTVGGKVPAGGISTGGAGPVDRIALPPGAGALVGVLPGSGSGSGQGAPPGTSYFLVTGGHRYGLASQSVAAMLGYDLAKQGVLLPANIADLIPAGPPLDPKKARQTVVTDSAGQ